ncbi:L,D-transpeptidase family protein [Emticicia agri]|uniref:L,D-TPase catalytic domain-containing protein n=1 Tax=Emticicia agri TaxID=2492393 RepID=A0A4Q5LU87_9BACT|nr:L,D-transpeptidase family protein [Emticicia agri]RYU93085.1 hypothetical protein EWM59_23935 [Emticicia agri]
MKPLLLLLLSMLPFISDPDFFTNQLKHPRVKEAYDSKGKIVEELLKLNNIHSSKFDLFLRALKKEKKLEVWAKNKNEATFKLIKTYDFCETSGVLGPKRRSGDRQIPEGFYYITTFNPYSDYHLSFKINYPNAADLVHSDKLNPGGDIFIHGDCVTIGCIPLGADNINIKELYILAAKAKSAGGTTHVYIFPCYMNEENYKDLQTKYADNKNLLDFWANLKPVYNAFEKSKTIPGITVDRRGFYQLLKPEK